MPDNDPFPQDSRSGPGYRAGTDASTGARSPGGTRVLWAGLVVAAGAGVLTAHGLIVAAAGSGVPGAIAWLYPVITDGLALVAYAATIRLTGSGRGYAWVVVVLAAGLSAVAQAAFLSTGAGQATPALRSAVGAWPAMAAAIAAHLLFLIGTTTGPPLAGASPRPVSASVDIAASMQPTRPTSARSGLPAGVTGVHPVDGVQLDPVHGDGVQRGGSVQPPPSSPGRSRPGVHEPGRGGPVRKALSPLDRARFAAELHARQSGSLPTVRALAELAEVSTGTAGNALRALHQPDPAQDPHSGLHLVTDPQAPNSATESAGKQP